MGLLSKKANANDGMFSSELMKETDDYAMIWYTWSPPPKMPPAQVLSAPNRPVDHGAFLIVHHKRGINMLKFIIPYNAAWPLILRTEVQIKTQLSAIKKSASLVQGLMCIAEDRR